MQELFEQGILMPTSIFQKKKKKFKHSKVLLREEKLKILILYLVKRAFEK